MLIAEIASNADAYALSTYYHKDRGGKLRAGPVWDYNLTFGNDLLHFFGAYCDRSKTDVWQFEYSNVGANFWGKLFNNPTFKCYAFKRFNEVTNTGAPLSYEAISDLIDTTVALISEAVVCENENTETLRGGAGVPDERDQELEQTIFVENENPLTIGEPQSSFNNNLNALCTPNNQILRRSSPSSSSTETLTLYQAAASAAVASPSVEPLVKRASSSSGPRNYESLIFDGFRTPANTPPQRGVEIASSSGAINYEPAPEFRPEPKPTTKRTL
jgi:hypothetical protein